MPRSRFNELYHDSAMAFLGVKPNAPSAFRRDADSGFFIQRELESLEARYFEVREPPLKFRTLFPVNNGHRGAEFISWNMVRRVGKAKWISVPSDDLPRVDAFREKFSVAPKPFGDAIGYDRQEMERMAFSGLPLEAERLKSARRAAEIHLSQTAWSGDTTLGVHGILTHPGIDWIQAAASAESGNPRTWDSAKTATEIVNDIRTVIQDIRVDSSGAEEGPDTLVLPIAQHMLLTARPWATAGTTYPTTIMQFLMDPKNGYGIKRVEWDWNLTGAGPAGEDVALFYKYNPDNFEFYVPMELEPLPPEARNLEFLINLWGQAAGMAVRYGGSARKLYNI